MARIERPGFPPDAAIADDAGIARLPGDERERGDVANRHVVRVVGLLSESPHSESGEARAPFENILKMTGGDGLGFGDAVDIDELGQHEFDLIFAQEDGCFFGSHGWLALLASSGKK